MVSTRVYRWTLVLMTVVLMTVVLITAALVALAAPALAHAKGATARTLTVCQHGCRYGTIQSAVDHSGRGAYGLYAFRCVGGRMTQSVGYGLGDSAFYVGGTPPQKHPQTTTLNHLLAYKNVFGFSGSNSKYMVIRDSEFYDNGAGLIPNTGSPSPFNRPATA